MNEYASFGLGGHYQYDTEQIRSEARPGRIRDGQNGSIHETADGVFFLSRDKEVIAPQLELDPEPFKDTRHQTEVWIAHIFDRDRALGHRGQTDPRSDLDHVWQDTMLGTAQSVYSLNR